MLSAAVLKVIMLNVIMLSVIMLNAIMLSVVMPFTHQISRCILVVRFCCLGF
jgi:hypothetical protein